MKKSISMLIIAVLLTAVLSAQTTSMASTCNTGNCGSFTVKIREGKDVNLTEVFFDVTNNTTRELYIKLFYEDKNGKWRFQGFQDHFKGGTTTTFDAFGNNPGPTKNYVIAYKNMDDTKTQFPNESDIQKKYGKPDMYHSQYNQ